MQAGAQGEAVSVVGAGFKLAPTHFYQIPLFLLPGLCYTLNMRRMLIALAVAIFLPLEGQADQNGNKDEDDYVKEWCPENDGKLEWPLDDRTEVDCLTDTHVVEFKRAGEWSKVLKGIGQAIHSAQQIDVNRRPGIVLIVEDKKGCNNLSRLRKTLEGVSVNESPVELLPPIGPYAEKCPK